MKITIFVPLFNEDEGVVNLKEQLLPVLKKLTSLNFDYELLLLDDGSTDGTWSKLQTEFGKLENSILLRHKVNQNLGGGLRTAITKASGELFTSLDADCTYAPKILLGMLDLFIKENADVVTASPYHPQGKVVGLPLYRLIPSFTASWIYQFLTKEKINTFTSMVRIYKTKDLKALKIESQGFLVFAEVLLKLLRKKKKVIEFPAILTVRQFNKSKMRILQVTIDHLGLMWKLALGKIQ